VALFILEVTFGKKKHLDLSGFIHFRTLGGHGSLVVFFLVSSWYCCIWD